MAAKALRGRRRRPVADLTAGLLDDDYPSYMARWRATRCPLTRLLSREGHGFVVMTYNRLGMRGDPMAAEIAKEWLLL